MIITSADFVMSNTDPGKCPRDGKPEYAFIGRSNVGKSSLINMLVRRKGLALTSGTPGKTLLINHFLVNKAWYIVDLPGYGYARRGKKEREQLSNIIRAYIVKREELTCLFQLIDCRLDPQKNDLEFTNWLGENGIPFALIFTKADKQSPTITANNVRTYLHHLEETWEEMPLHFVTSAAKGTGRDDVLDYIGKINASLKP